MWYLLQLEWKKFKHFRTFKVMAILYVILLPLIMIVAKAFFAKVEAPIDFINIKTVQSFPEIWGILLPFLTPYHLVQHSNFDKNAIGAACKAYRLPAPDLSWSDSVKIARQAWPEFKGNGGHGLGHLKTALNLNFKHHDAGEDARASAQVVMLAEERLRQSFDQIAQTRIKAQMSLPI